MICKVCGYKFNKSKKISKCPFCGKEISLQKQKRKYNKNNEHSQLVLLRKYRTMPQNFKKLCSSFELNQDELKMSCFVDGGQFSFFGYLIPFITIFVWLILCSFVKMTIPPEYSYLIEFFMVITFFISVAFVSKLTYVTFIVNSSGIIVKTPLKEYFIPKEKIDSIVCRRIIRGENASSSYDLFIKLRNKDKHLFNKIDIDTGLCYTDRIQVKYLVDKFNEYLGFIQDEGDQNDENGFIKYRTLF